MADTALGKKEKLKKSILEHIEHQSNTEPPNPHEFTLSGISLAVGENYSRSEVQKVLDELSDDNEDDLLVEKNFETKIYLSKSNESFSKKFKDCFKSPYIGFFGAAIIILLAWFYSFQIFINPEQVKVGFIIGVLVMVIFGRTIGALLTQGYNAVLDSISKASSIKKRSITVVLSTIAVFLIILYTYSFFVNRIEYTHISAWDVLGVVGVGATVGTIIAKWLK